jgi:hypothetical protein
MLRAAFALVLTLLMPFAFVAPAAGAAKRSACQRLKGKDLAPAQTVKLVARPNADDGTDLLGCVLPRGAVREVAGSADYYTTVYGYALRQVAGRIVLVSSSYSSQYAYSEGTRVVDLRSGRAYTIAYRCQEITGSNCGDETVARAAFVTKIGRAVAAIAGPGAMTIATFDPAGVRRDLDSGPEADIPPASLALTGTFATWMHAAQPRRADISAPG